MKRVCRNFRERMAMVMPVLALAVCLLSSSAAASSRVLVVHNKTDATILVTTSREVPATGLLDHREELIPPKTKKSLFNFLIYGRNEVKFWAPYTSPEVKWVARVFYAQHTDVKTKVLEVLPRDFGKSVMFDRPSAGTGSKQGTWQKVGVGDCSGHDVDRSGGFTPLASKAFQGRTAVCWDGIQYKNRHNPAFCTYKKIDANRCSGGDNPGVIYRAVVRP